MDDIASEFESRRSLVENANYTEATTRFGTFYDWLRDQPALAQQIDQLLSSVDTAALLEGTSYKVGPQTATPDEVAALGLHFLRLAKDEGEDPGHYAMNHGIRLNFTSNRIQDFLDAMLARFVTPALDRLALTLNVANAGDSPVTSPRPLRYPRDITDSLKRFQRDHPEYDRNAFIMMQFGTTKRHGDIVEAIRSTLETFGIAALRADDKEYHDDLFPNVLTYIYGCRFGIAVFERLEADDFNPNVSLEVGYMRALHKPICLLKDRTLKTLQTDLVGKLYKQFDAQDPNSSIPSELERWLYDKDIVTL